MSTLVIGLDVQKTRLGWGVCHAIDGTPWSWGCWPIPPKGIGATIRQHLLDISWTLDPQHNVVVAVYLEAPHVGHSRHGAMEHAMVIGRTAQQAESIWPNAAVELIAPQEWKPLVGLPGNAQKHQIAAWARAGGIEHPMQDALDASAIALAGQRRNAAMFPIPA